MPPYAVTSFENLDALQRERALFDLSFNAAFTEFRMDVTGTEDGDNFLSRLMVRHSAELETDPEAVSFISAEAEKHHIYFGLMTGKAYPRRKYE